MKMIWLRASTLIPLFMYRSTCRTSTLWVASWAWRCSTATTLTEASRCPSTNSCWANRSRWTIWSQLTPTSTTALSGSCKTFFFVCFQQPSKSSFLVKTSYRGCTASNFNVVICNLTCRFCCFNRRAVKNFTHALIWNISSESSWVQV